MAKSRVIVFVGVLLTCMSATADTFYVDDDAPPGGDGSSWPQSFRFLSDALDAVSSEEDANTILVAGGTYLPDHSNAHPNGTLDRLATFAIPGFTTIRGGYAGIGGADPNARDIEMFATILSGDLSGDGSSHSPNNETRNENSRHVITLDDVVGTVRLDGLWIVGGFADATDDNKGAGITANDCVLEIDHCRFELNSCEAGDRPRGGAVSAVRVDLKVRDSVFRNNRLNSGLGQHWPTFGGGALAVQTSSVLLDGCVFEDNEINASSGDHHGGALWIATQSEVTIRNSEFIDNECSGHSADAKGGAAYITSSTVTVEDSVFCDNSGWCGGTADISGSATGGALYINDSTVHFSRVSLIRNRAYGDQIGRAGGVYYREANLTAVNCVAVNNTAGDEDLVQGSGFIGANSSAEFTNCTIAGEDGGTVGQLGGLLTVRNSILWTDAQLGTHAALVGIPDTTVEISSSCVSVLRTEWDLGGNIQLDPVFADLENDDIRLLSGSPCIDAANNLALPAGTIFDSRGAIRRYEDASTPNTGLGIPPLVDMGAVEFFPDCNTNLQPDEIDVAELPAGVESGSLGPFGENTSIVVSFDSPPARSDVAIEVTAYGDLHSTNEFVSLELNHQLLAELFVVGAADCGASPDSETVVLSSEDFNALVEDQATLRLIPSDRVSDGACDGLNYLTVSVSYLTSVAADANNNGVPDSCEVSGDVSGDLSVDLQDLLLILEYWGACEAPCPPMCVGDMTGATGGADCVVNLHDLLLVLDSWTG